MFATAVFYRFKYTPDCAERRYRSFFCFVDLDTNEDPLSPGFKLTDHVRHAFDQAMSDGVLLPCTSVPEDVSSPVLRYVYRQMEHFPKAKWLELDTNIYTQMISKNMARYTSKDAFLHYARGHCFPLPDASLIKVEELPDHLIRIKAAGNSLPMRSLQDINFASRHYHNELIRLRAELESDSRLYLSFLNEAMHQYKRAAEQQAAHPVAPHQPMACAS